MSLKTIISCTGLALLYSCPTYARENVVKTRVRPLFINFQPEHSSPVRRYLKDHGAVYGERENGLIYGWNTDHKKLMGEYSGQKDELRNTLCRMASNGVWEIAIPNGDYRVRAVVGHPRRSSKCTLNVEGVSYWKEANLSAKRSAIKYYMVTVRDGKLTLDQGNTANKDTCINYINIIPVR